MFGLRKFFTKPVRREIQLTLPEARPLIRKEDLQLVTESRDTLRSEVSEIRDIASSLVLSLNSELESVRRRMETILDCMPDSMIMTKFSGEIISINDATERLLGLTEPQTVGSQIDQFLCLDKFRAIDETLRLNCSDYASFILQRKETVEKLGPTEARKLYAEFMREHPVFGESLAATITTRSGISKSAEVVVNILNPEATSREALVLMFHIRDTSERSEVFNRLDSLTQFQLGLLSAVPNPVFYFNRDYAFAGCNPAYAKFLNSVENTKLPIESFMPDSEQRGYTAFKIDLGRLPVGEVAHFKTKITVGTTVREVIIYASALRDSHSDFNGFVATIVDLTPMLEAQKFQEALIDAVPNPIYFVDSNLKISGCNVAFEELVARTKTDIVGKTVGELLLDELAQSAQLKRLLLDQRARDFELFSGRLTNLSCETQIYSRAKHTFIDVVQSSRALIKDNAFDGILTVLTDVSDLKEVQRFQQHLFESMPHPVFYKDADLCYVGCNKAYADLFSLTPEEICNKTREEVFQYIVTLPTTHPAYQVFFKHRKHFAQIMSELAAKDLELLSCVNMGTIQTIEMNIFSIAHDSFRSYVFYRTGIYSNGVFKGIIGSMLDITPIKDAVSTKTALLETSPNAVLLRDSRGIIVDCNSAFLTMVGKTAQDILGKTLSTADLASYEPTLAKSRELSCNEGNIIYETEVYSHKHKEVHYYLVYHNSVLTEGVDGSICIWNDVTAIKKATLEIAEREAQLAVVINASPDLITCEDMQGNILLKNRAFDNFFLGHFAVDRGRFDELQRKLTMELVAKPNSNLRRTVSLYDALGIPHHLDVFKAIVQVAEDAKVLTVSTDVSHLITHLLQTKALSTALNNINELVVVVNASGNITFMNWMFNTHFGIEPSSFLDIAITEVIVGLPPIANFKLGFEGTVFMKKTNSPLYVKTYVLDQDTDPVYVLVMYEVDKDMGHASNSLNV